MGRTFLRAISCSQILSREDELSLSECQRVKRVGTRAHRRQMNRRSVEGRLIRVREIIFSHFPNLEIATVRCISYFSHPAIRPYHPPQKREFVQTLVLRLCVDWFVHFDVIITNTRRETRDGRVGERLRARQSVACL